MSLTRISGLFSFDGRLCGGGAFTGTRAGYELSWQFVSEDPDCAFDDGRTFVFEGTMARGYREITGRYTIPSVRQQGTIRLTMTAERPLAAPSGKAAATSADSRDASSVTQPSAAEPSSVSDEGCAEYDSFECASGTVTDQVDIDSFSRTRYYRFVARQGVQYIIDVQELATQQIGRRGNRTVTMVLYDANRRRLDYRVLRNGTGGQLRYIAQRPAELYVSVGADRPSLARVDGYAFTIVEARR